MEQEITVILCASHCKYKICVPSASVHLLLVLIKHHLSAPNRAPSVSAAPLCDHLTCLLSPVWAGPGFRCPYCPSEQIRLSSVCLCKVRRWDMEQLKGHLESMMGNQKRQEVNPHNSKTPGKLPDGTNESTVLTLSCF